MNFSTSSQANGRYANAPAGYAQIPNSIQLDQFAFYIERQPDTVQKDHFDWGFRLTNLYGLVYRFTAAKGYFSQQLLKPNPDGTIGKKYGYDPEVSPAAARLRLGKRTRNSPETPASAIHGRMAATTPTFVLTRSTMAATPTTTFRRTMRPGITSSTRSGTLPPSPGTNTSAKYPT